MNNEKKLVVKFNYKDQEHEIMLMHYREPYTKEKNLYVYEKNTDSFGNEYYKSLELHTSVLRECLIALIEQKGENNNEQ